MLECVVNISEGRRRRVIEALVRAAGRALLDVHTDADHNRSVLTLIGEEAPRAVAAAAVDLIDIAVHDGVHPRIGAVDVVPFVPLGRSSMADALRARDSFAAWVAATLGVPCLLYGPERSLPDLRRSAREGLCPDTGPSQPHPTAGVIAVGARPVLVAYNLWLAEADLALARRLASELRGPVVRTLGLAVGDQVQLSANLISPLEVGPADLYDAVTAKAAVARAEVVGLVPAAVLERIPSDRWPALDLSEATTIEARLTATGFGVD